MDLLQRAAAGDAEAIDVLNRGGVTAAGIGRTVIVQVGGRSYAWKPDEHPRDQHGKFISKGGIVRTISGELAKVDNVLDANHIEVTNAAGDTSVVNRHDVTVTQAPDGGAPTGDVSKVATEVAHDPSHPEMPDHNSIDAPDSHHIDAKPAPRGTDPSHYTVRKVEPRQWDGSGPTQWQIYEVNADGSEGEWVQTRSTKHEADTTINRMAANNRADAGLESIAITPPNRFDRRVLQRIDQTGEPGVAQAHRAIQKLEGRGWIEPEGDGHRLTDAGRAALGGDTPKAPVDDSALREAMARDQAHADRRQPEIEAEAARTAQLLSDNPLDTSAATPQETVDDVAESVRSGVDPPADEHAAQVQEPITEFDMRASRVPEAIARVEAANRRAERAGITDRITYEVQEYDEPDPPNPKDPGGPQTYTRRATFTVNVPEIKHEGYTFVGTMTWDSESGLITRVAPGQSLARRPHARECNVCKSIRDRRDTYIVRNEATGEETQVGSNCLQQFMGIRPSALWMLTWDGELGDLKGTDDYDGERGWGSGDSRAPITDVLATALAVINDQGWMSRQTARDYEKTATADTVMNVMYGRATNEDDRRWRDQIRADATALQDEAAALQEFARNIEGDSEYADNLRAIAGGRTVDARNLPLLVSVYAAKQRADRERVQQEEREKQSAESTHLGEIGGKIQDHPARIVNVSQHSNAYGISTLVLMVDGDGNVLKWFASGSKDYKIGDDVSVSGTIKNHDEYRGVKQTVITRAKLVPRDPADTPAPGQTEDTKPIKWRRHDLGFVSDDGNYLIQRGSGGPGSLYKRATADEYNNDSTVGMMTPGAPFEYGREVGADTMGALRQYAEDDRRDNPPAPGIDSGTPPVLDGPVNPTMPAAPDPTKKTDPQSVAREVQYQMDEYDLDRNTAAENVADYLGLPWQTVMDYSINPDHHAWLQQGGEPATEPSPDLPYSVITQHEPDRRTVRHYFPSYDAAKAWGEAHNPDTDGSMVPNIDPDHGEHPEYQSGLFWPSTHENKYAAIHKSGSNQYGSDEAIPDKFKQQEVAPAPITVDSQLSIRPAADDTDGVGDYVDARFDVIVDGKTIGQITRTNESRDISAQGDMFSRSSAAVDWWEPEADGLRGGDLARRTRKAAVIDLLMHRNMSYAEAAQLAERITKARSDEAAPPARKARKAGGRATASSVRQALNRGGVELPSGTQITEDRYKANRVRIDLNNHVYDFTGTEAKQQQIADHLRGLGYEVTPHPEVPDWVDVQRPESPDEPISDDSGAVVPDTGVTRTWSGQMNKIIDKAREAGLEVEVSQKTEHGFDSIGVMVRDPHAGALHIYANKTAGRAVAPRISASRSYGYSGSPTDIKTKSIGSYLSSMIDAKRVSTRSADWTSTDPSLRIRYDGPADGFVPKRRNRDANVRYNTRWSHAGLEGSRFGTLVDRGQDPRGDRLTVPAGSTDESIDVTSAPIDKLRLTEVTPEDLAALHRYDDVRDGNTGQSYGFTGYDPVSDMVKVMDGETGDESWLPRQQLVAIGHPGMRPHEQPESVDSAGIPLANLERPYPMSDHEFETHVYPMARENWFSDKGRVDDNQLTDAEHAEINDWANILRQSFETGEQPMTWRNDN